MSITPRININPDNHHVDADLDALKAALEARFPDMDVTISDDAVNGVSGVLDPKAAEAAEAAYKAVCDRCDY